MSPHSLKGGNHSLGRPLHLGDCVESATTNLNSDPEQNHPTVPDTNKNGASCLNQKLDLSQFFLWWWSIAYTPMSRQYKTGNKIHDLRQEIAALRRERAEANNEPDILLRNLKIRWANFKLDEAMSKLRRLI